MSNPNVPSEIVMETRQADVLPERDLHQFVGKALKHCQRWKTRDDIAREISDFTGQRVTKRMLDDWSAESKAHVSFPARFVKPLCAVTGDDSLQRQLLSDEMRADLERGQFVRTHGWLLQRIHDELDKVITFKRAEGLRLLKLAARRRKARRRAGKRDAREGSRKRRR